MKKRDPEETHMDPVKTPVDPLKNKPAEQNKPKEPMPKCVLPSVPCMKGYRKDIYAAAKLCKTATTRRCKEKPDSKKFCKHTYTEKGISRYTKKNLCSYITVNPSYKYKDHVEIKDFKEVELKKNLGKSIVGQFFTPMTLRPYEGGYINKAYVLAYLSRIISDKVAVYFQKGELSNSVANWDNYKKVENEEGEMVIQFYENDAWLLTMPTELKSYLRKRSKKRFVFMFMHLGKEIPYQPKDSSSHSNFLVFDTERKIVYRYEPSGYGLYDIFDMDILDDEMRKWCKGIGYKYEEPWESCPRQMFAKVAGIQRLAKDEGFGEKDPGGFCKVWSTFMFEQKMRNPEMSFDDLQGMLLKRFKDNQIDMTEFARNYLTRVNQLGEQILLEKGYNPQKQDPISFFEKHWKKIMVQ
jgi:hypothetical protein